MTLWDKVIKSLELTPHTGAGVALRMVRGAYCGDLLSDVLANAAPGNLWVTIQRHRNVIAVAALINLSGVIITGGRIPEKDTVYTAEKEGIPLFSTQLNNYQASGKLYNILAGTTDSMDTSCFPNK